MDATDLIQIDYLRGIVRELTAAGHGGRGDIIGRASAFLGLSKQSLYVRLRSVGWSSGRKLRTDKGDSDVAESEVLAVAAVMRSSRRANGKTLLPVPDAIDIALANELLSTRVTPTTMLRLMRRYHCHPAQLAQPEPHVDLRSLHPNHVWQLDASVCVLYRLRNGKVNVMDHRKFNERKPRDLAAIINERVLRYAVTDHTSGALYARYYETAGEDQLTLFEFLMAAFNQRPEGLMHGVPAMLVWDKGSANIAHGIQNLLTSLAVRHWTHLPGNPRAKGQVEGVHNVIERKFEGRLSFVRIDCINVLNAHLDTWLRDFNGNAIHSRHGSTRWGVWQTIREDQLRLCPPLATCRDLMISKPQPRTVAGNLTISFKYRGYAAGQYYVGDIDTLRVGDVIDVSVNPYRAPNIFVVMKDDAGAVRYHECQPVAEDRFGFAVDGPVIGERFNAKPDTNADSARKRINDLAYGERETLAADNAKVKGRLAFDGAIDPFKNIEERAAQVPAFMQRRGTELHTPSPAHVDLKPLSHVEALYELRAKLGRPLARDEAALVAQRYPDGVPYEDLDALHALLLNPNAEDQPRPRLVAVK